MAATAANQDAATAAVAAPVNVCVLFYSLYGHTYKLARAVAEGVQQTPGCTVTLLQARSPLALWLNDGHWQLTWTRRVPRGVCLAAVQVPETIPEAILEKTGAKAAKAEFANVPVASFGMLKNFDAIIVGTPTRFGDMCGQMRNFWDTTGPLWAKGAATLRVA